MHKAKCISNKLKIKNRKQKNGKEFNTPAAH